MNVYRKVGCACYPACHLGCLVDSGDHYEEVKGPVFLIDRVAGLMVDDSDVVLRGLIDDGILKEIK